MDEEIIKLIREMAQGDVAQDDEDFLVDDYAGGNIDDAYYLGFSDGQISFAKSIVAKLEDPK